MAYAGSYQSQVFAAGGSPFPFTAKGLEEAALDNLPREYFDYIAGGAGSERTVAANEAAFSRWGLIYRVLRDGVAADASSTLLGTPMSVPVMLAPAGVADLAHPEAERAAARAAERVGAVQVLSAVTSVSLEEVAQAAPRGRRWFQFAWPDDEKLARSLIERAEAAGYGALVVMGDCYVAGWRTRELSSGFFPFRHAHGLGNYVSDRRFWELAGFGSMPEDLDDLTSEMVAAAASTWNRVFTKPALLPEDLAVLRSWTRMPIVVKGVCHPDEATRLCEAGIDALIVSNHGGRQLDGGVAALDCLPPVVAAVAGRVPVLFDSGVRTGTDVLIALALGADAVMIGRPWLYGLAVGGQAGVEHVLRSLREEFTSALALTGHRRCSSLSTDDVFPVVPPHGPRDPGSGIARKGATRS
ncbi:alpha-hydroxy-acid oxidizing protein [Thermomonospora umbrina]|uniref:Isopentenyl diphosphate isomerase/L-lactate dehydrogenase-like FMN-dependent dehydrogenase n=1 Tax=Thermomonospora umbrina TaxID=111806 RepID=A0A3D9SXY3_9ACTN|nr:alpha-hydroxy-acid oxidizing protein [Thermomonospora umbrina]REF00428.1 isopentenyl diphosphate isomerase/L-lactate dehydrogenase-like FMN-dependent dehydrogenase [Thermomonospora umbrina]